MATKNKIQNSRKVRKTDKKNRAGDRVAGIKRKPLRPRDLSDKTARYKGHQKYRPVEAKKY
jgi:hypothetical protein